jgi:hypothetical protein
MAFRLFVLLPGSNGKKSIIHVRPEQPVDRLLQGENQ